MSIYSTSATVSVMRLNGTVSQIYNESSGEIAKLGVILYQHYTEIQKIEVLIALGETEEIHENLVPPLGVKHGHMSNSYCLDYCQGVTIFRGRDKKEKCVEASHFKNLEEYKKNNDFQKCNYFFNQAKSTWYVFDPQKKKLKTLELFLKKEAANNRELQNMLDKICIEKEKILLNEKFAHIPTMTSKKINKI